MNKMHSLKTLETLNNSDQQYASANAEADAKLSKKSEFSGNKPIYLVTVLETENPTKIRTFASFKTNLNHPNYLDIVGCELPNTKTQKSINLDNIKQEIEKSNKETVLDIKFPWHRVINIINVNYKHR
jgi:hypothetical protein